MSTRILLDFLAASYLIGVASTFFILRIALGAFDGHDSTGCFMKGITYACLATAIWLIYDGMQLWIM